MRITHWILAGSAVAACAVLAAPVMAADAKGEITTAAQHASLAAQAGDMAGVKMHLHHAINCLEGPKGADFSKTDMNPCANSGNGAIPDSTNPTTTASLQTAVGQAVSGLKASDMKAAQGDASATAATLQAIK
jgi:hypothetical protein